MNKISEIPEQESIPENPAITVTQVTAKPARFKRTPLFMPFPEKLRHIPESSMNITQMLRSQTAVMG